MMDRLAPRLKGGGSEAKRSMSSGKPPVETGDLFIFATFTAIGVRPYVNPWKRAMVPDTLETETTINGRCK
jgi:hypothetical protein